MNINTLVQNTCGISRARLGLIVTRTANLLVVGILPLCGGVR